MFMRSGKALALGVVALGLVTTAANAGCQGRKTTGTVVGAVAGGVLGNVLTHGSTGGTIAGAVVGGVAGHEINGSGCHGRDREYEHDRRDYGRGHHHHDHDDYDDRDD